MFIVRLFSRYRMGCCEAGATDGRVEPEPERFTAVVKKKTQSTKKKATKKPAAKPVATRQAALRKKAAQPNKRAAPKQGAKAPVSKSRSKVSVKPSAAKQRPAKAGAKQKVTRSAVSQQRAPVITKKKLITKKSAVKEIKTPTTTEPSIKTPLQKTDTAAKSKTTARKSGSAAPASEPKSAAARLLASRPAEGTPPRAAARAAVDLDGIKLPKGYRPRAEESYMNPKHLLYFRNKLEAWREELIEESQETLEHLRTETRDVGDEAERASRESDNILELRTRDRYRKLLRKIEQALERIEDGSYGYCEETGEEIGLARLEARPIATLTVDAQERRELVQRQYRDER